MSIVGVDPSDPRDALCECGHRADAHVNGIYADLRDVTLGRCYVMALHNVACPCNRFTLCFDLGAARDTRPPKPCCHKLPDGNWCTLPVGHHESHDPKGHLK